MKREFYEKPKLEVVEISVTDLICTSGKIEEDDGSNDGEWI